MEPTSDSVDVLLEPALLLQVRNEAHGLGRGARAVVRNDIHQRALDVLGHAFGIAANIEMRALREPGPQFTADLAHAVLHIELLLAVARPGERKPREQARGFHRVELVLIEEVAVAALMAEEQPVLA